MNTHNSDELIYWTIIAGILVLCAFVLFRLLSNNDPKKRVQKWIGITLLSVFVLFILFANELLPGSKMYYDYEYSERITGHSMSITELYTYESYREPLLGDGYSLYVYKMDEESTAYFRNPDASFYTNFPSVYPGSGDWVTKNWTKTPINSEDSVYRDFALNEVKHFGAPDVSKLDKVEILLWQMLDKQGSYYAYRAKYHGGMVWNIEFYILSPEKGYLIAIYSDM